MNYNIPSHVSPATIAQAHRLVKSSKLLDFNVGSVYWDDTGDFLYFMFANKARELIMIWCAPKMYFIEEYETFDRCEFSMSTNIRHVLTKINKAGFRNCEHLKEK